MAEMISKGLRRYDGRDLQPGERFQVNEEGHVRTLIASRLAERVPEPETAPAVSAEAKKDDVPAAVIENPTTEAPAARDASQSYQTRDLQAAERPPRSRNHRT